MADKTENIGRYLPRYKKPWTGLTPLQKKIREKAVEVLSKARRTRKSLSRLSKEVEIHPWTVLRATNAFRKVRHRWEPKKFDRISRVMAMNENGQEIFVEVKDSRHASKIGKYQSAVREFLLTDNTQPLAEFKGKWIKDGIGNFRFFETDPDVLRAIGERREEPEFFEIYEV